MKQAKSAMQLFLRSLPEDCFFQLISYSRETYNCFDGLLPYNGESFEVKKTCFLSNFRISPITDIFLFPCAPPSQEIVFFNYYPVHEILIIVIFEHTTENLLK